MQYTENAMKRNYHLLIPTVFALAAFLSGCGDRDSLVQEEQEPDSGTVALTVWGAEEDEELLRQIFEGFQEKYRGEAEFLITNEHKKICKQPRIMLK